MNSGARHSSAQELVGVDDGDRCGAGKEAGPRARLARCAERVAQALRVAQLGRAAGRHRASPAALALATHNSTDPSFTTAAGGPPTNWLGSTGAYASDALLLLFGLGSVLFLPVIALAGLRMIRLEPSGRIGRGLLIAAIGAVLVGIALSLLSGSAVSGLPSGWGGVLALAAANGVECGVAQIGNPSVEGPLRLTLLLLFAVGGLALGYLSMGLLPDEKGWLARAAAPRCPAQGRGAAAHRGACATSAPAPPRRRARAPRSRSPSRRRPSLRRRAEPPPARPARRQPSLAFGGVYTLPTLDLLTPPPASGRTQIDRAGLERNARLLEIGARGFPRPRRHRRGPPGPGGDDVRARAGQRDQGQPGDPARRRHRPQHVGAVGARRDDPGAQRDRHRAAQPQARGGHSVRADRQPGVRGPEHVAAADPRQEHRRRPGDRRPRADAAFAGRRHHRLGQVGRPQLHDPVVALQDDARTSAG